jgi:hypothetical protein
MVNPRSISSPIMLYQARFEFRPYSKLVGFLVIPPLKQLIKPMMSCIDHWWVQQFTCLLNHGFIILPFVVLTPPCNNRHANIPNLFHICVPCLWPIGRVKPIVLPLLCHGRSKIELFT